MKHRFTIAMLLLSSWVCGCVTPVDKTWHEAYQAGATVSRTFSRLVSGYSAAADEMAAKKHDLQRVHVERDLDDFLRIHTNAEGRLVSIQPDGTEKPLLAADFKKAVELRDAKLAQVEASARSWRTVQGPMAEAITRFDVLTEQLSKTEASAYEAKQSAQQFIDSVLSAVGGVAAGAGGAMLIP